MDEIKKIWPKWEVISVLGQGGFGKVYKIKRNTFGEETYAAVKVVKIPSDMMEVDEVASTGLSPEDIKEYYREITLHLLDEIKMMEKMKSASHIVAIEDYEVVENENSFGWTVYIRMELLKNLAEYTKEHPMDEAEVRKLGLDLLKALEFCHDSNVIHRDIKPQNIFVSQFGEYKIGDFGISREVEKANATMSQKGTKTYMAPEMIRLAKYGKSVDIYALGLTMYELLNHGRMPFFPPYPQKFYPSDRETAMLRRLNGEPLPDADGASPKMNEILKRALAANPQNRYQNAKEMRDALLHMDQSLGQSVNREFVNQQEENRHTGSYSDETEPMSRGNQCKKSGGGWLFEDSRPDPLSEKQKEQKLLPLQRICPDCGKIEYLQFTNGYRCGTCGRVHTYKQDSNTLMVRQLFEEYIQNPVSGKDAFFAVMRMTAIDTASAQLTLRAGIILNNEGAPDKALEYFIDALSMDDRDANIHTSLGVAYYKMGDYQKALECQEKAYRQWEKGLYSWDGGKIILNNYYTSLLKNNRNEEAFAIYQKAKNAGYDNLEAWDNQLNISKDWGKELEDIIEQDAHKRIILQYQKKAQKKDAKIRLHFKTIPKDAKIYLFEDYTMLGSAKEGVAISSAGIHRIGMTANDKQERYISWKKLRFYSLSIPENVKERRISFVYKGALEEKEKNPNMYCFFLDYNMYAVVWNIVGKMWHRQGGRA